MKKLILSIVLISIGFLTQAQDPDPELFQTWYVYASYADLEEPSYFYGEDVPQMTINEDFSFTAIDNCFEISGNFEYTEDTDFDFGLINLNYEKDCILGGNQGGTLEQIYLYQDGAMGCELYQLPNGSYELSINTYPGFGLGFRNQITLSVPEQQLQNVIISPNPANEHISILGLTNQMDQINIIDIGGKTIYRISFSNTESIDISKLKAGIYFMQITLEGNTTVKKFIKR